MTGSATTRGLPAPGVISLAAIAMAVPVARDLLVRLHPDARTAIALSVYSALLGCVAFLLVRSRMSLREAGLTRPTPRSVLLGLAAALAVLAPGMVGGRGVRAPSLSLVSWVVLAVTAEELLFRGVLLALLTRVGGPALGVLGSSASFALAHAGAYPSLAILAVGVAGLYLGVLRLLSGNLCGPATAHALLDVFGGAT